MRVTLKMIWFFLFLTSLVGFAEDTPQVLPKTLYDQGKFQEALDLMQKNELRTASDFYNAGNCYYKLGRLGQAFAYFQKASTLAPSDDDVQYNLKLTESFLEKKGGVLQASTLWSGRAMPLLRRISEVFADLLLALCTVALAIVCNRLKKKSFRLKRVLTEPSFLFVLGLWSFSCAFTIAVVMTHSTKLAAVISDSGIARSGPSETFTELSKLPPGSQVELTGENREGWSQIRFSLGNVGWIMEKDLLKL